MDNVLSYPANNETRRLKRNFLQLYIRHGDVMRITRNFSTIIDTRKLEWLKDIDSGKRPVLWLKIIFTDQWPRSVNYGSVGGPRVFRKKVLKSEIKKFWNPK